MKAKKLYMQPEMKTVVMAMPSALLAGSGADLITPTSGVTGDEWTDE